MISTSSAYTRNINVDTDLMMCPYNSAHCIVQSRMGRHLIKCAKNYPDAPKVKCRFNANHIINMQEAEFHEESCPDRVKWDTFTYRVGSTQCPVKGAVPIHVEVPESSENWDDAATGPSPLDSINKNILEKPIVRVLCRSGMTKSERKAFNAEEQRRLQKIADDENAKKAVAKEPRKPAPISQPASTAPLRLPKTSKVMENALTAKYDKEVDKLSKKLNKQSLSGTPRPLTGFDTDTYFDNKYVGGYSKPATSTSSGAGARGGYGDESDADDFDDYAARGYDVDYYGGYSGGRAGEGGGDYSHNYQYSEDEEKEVEEEKKKDDEKEEGASAAALEPRWVKVGKRRQQGAEHEQRLKAVQQQEQAGKVTGKSDKVEQQPQLKMSHFRGEVDEMGFLKHPIVGRGRGSRRF